MSVVSLSDQMESAISAEDLRRIAATNNIKISDPRDAEAYLTLLRSADTTIRTVKQLQPYIDPRVMPQDVAGGPRKFWKPLDKDNPLNAWSHRCELKSSSPSCFRLSGKSVAFKDNICIAGIPTTLGTFPQLVSPNGAFPQSAIDATVVNRLLKAGATIKGTTNCENYGTGPLSYSCAAGPVHNPWLPGYTCGGSSSGAAAVVALKKVSAANPGTSLGEGVDIAIGTDQGGSVRIPAAYTGIYGLKPTFGLVPYTGAWSSAAMVDTLGILAGTLSDVATALEMVAGYDGLDPRMSPESPMASHVKPYGQLLDTVLQASNRVDTANGSALRIGLLQESFGAPGLSPEVATMVRSTATEIFTSSGATVSEISIPMHSVGPSIWVAASRTAVVETGIRGLPSDLLTQPLPHLQPRWPPDQEMYDLLTATNPAVVNLIFQNTYVSETFGAGDLCGIQAQCLRLCAAYDEAFEHCDILITPAAPTPAMRHPRVGHAGGSIMDKIGLAVGSTSNTCPFNVSGHPAMTVPCGLAGPQGSDTKLPVGMQIVGRRFQDELVLQAAAIFHRGFNVE